MTSSFVKFGRTHLILPLGLMAVGLILMFDALSTASTGQPSWFFQRNDHELEWLAGLGALFAGVIWVGGRVGWWIVRTIIQWWFHELRKQSRSQ